MKQRPSWSQDCSAWPGTLTKLVQGGGIKQLGGSLRKTYLGRHLQGVTWPGCAIWNSLGWSDPEGQLNLLHRHKRCTVNCSVKTEIQRTPLLCCVPLLNSYHLEIGNCSLRVSWDFPCLLWINRICIDFRWAEERKRKANSGSVYHLPVLTEIGKQTECWSAGQNAHRKQACAKNRRTNLQRCQHFLRGVFVSRINGGKFGTFCGIFKLQSFQSVERMSVVENASLSQGSWTI